MKLNTELLRELGRAISEAVFGSERVLKIISDARARGADIELHLDAAVTLGTWPAEVPPQDQKFLKSAHVSGHVPTTAFPGIGAASWEQNPGKRRNRPYR